MLTVHLQLHGGFLRLVKSDVSGDASQNLAIVGPIQAARCILHSQRVVVHVRVVNRRSFFVADRFVV